MKTYKELYSKTLKIGHLRSDEYSRLDFIDDINEYSRKLWNYIFTVKNGYTPKVTYKETITVATAGDYTHTRTLKGKIEKIVFDCCEILKKTDPNCDECHSYSYNDSEITIGDAQVGDYTVYITPLFISLTETEYGDDAKPEWLEETFVPLLYLFPALKNTDTEQDKISELYKMTYQDFEDWYRDSEDFEGMVMGEAPSNRL